MMKRSLALLSPIVVAFLSACSSGTSQFTGECRQNEECSAGFICREGLCVCRGDESCDQSKNEFCNPQGRCQTRAGCRANDDCEGKFCDIATGACIERTGCGSDVHCPTGLICDLVQKTCVDGCFDDSDCPLYSICNKPSPTQLGTCLSGKCSNNAFCEYGSRCVNETCTPDTNPNHCKTCTNTDPNECGSRSNFCLINQSYDPSRPQTGSQYFCGVECQPGVTDACPNGYDCYSVSLLTQDLCNNDNDCGGEGRRCFSGEGQTSGACSCTRKEHCNSVFEVAAPPRCIGGFAGCEWPSGQPCTNNGQCQPLPMCANFLGFGNVCVTDLITQCTTARDCLCAPEGCIGTGKPCTSAAQCELECVDNGCYLGSACAPSPGLLCPDVR